MLFLIHTIESLFYPVGFVWACLTVAAIVMWRRKQRRGAMGCAFLSLVLYVCGATPIPAFLLARLERPFANATVGNAATADVVIVLGGNISPSAHDTFEFSLNASADRIIAGVEALRQKKAQALIVGGGSARIAEKEISEGERVVGFLRTWNLAPGEIIALPRCRNTREEAAHVRSLMAQHKWTNAILVTSAYHMARAVATFEKHGVPVRPVACDFEALPIIEGELPPFRLVPLTDHIKVFSLYVHETLGWYYYAARGWI